MSEATMSTALALIPASALPTILAADENDLLGKLRARIAAHHPDVSTPKGRDEIRSLAADVANSKMNLIRLGKKLTEGWRKSTAAVNAECRLLEECMDSLKAQVRQPLTDFENLEKERVRAHEDALAAIGNLFAEMPDDAAPADIEARIAQIDPLYARNWQEFAPRAAQERKITLCALNGALVAAQKREADAAEAAQRAAEEAERRRQEEERLRNEREAKIAAEAAERARQGAEEKAARQRAEAERQQQAEREAIARREREAADAIERANREKAEAIARAEREAAEAEQRRQREMQEAEARAQREKAAAVEAERQRQKDAAEADRLEAERRAANKAHRARVNTEAMNALVAAGLNDKAARTAVIAIARGNVPHVTISY